MLGRRWRTVLLAVASAWWALVPSSGSAAEPAKPNVVFVLVDDLDAAVFQSGLDAGLYPQIKTLMRTGTTFSNSFVSLSICCPSRSSFLTGQYPHNHGTLRNNGPAGGYKSFNPVSTLGVWLQGAGYRTGLLGKYLNGYNEKTRHETPPGWESWQALLSLKMYDYSLTAPGGAVEKHGSAPEDYQTDVLAAHAESFVRSTDSRPFLLVLTPSAPHLEGEEEVGEDDGGKGIRPAPRHAGTPGVALPVLGQTSFNESDMSDKPQWMRKAALTDAAEMGRIFNEKRVAMRAVDDMVGRLVRALKETGRWDNTLFVFTSDNGFQYGTHRKSATKVDFYEESIRVPLVIRAPGQTAARRTDAWAVNNDWAVTIMDVAGLQPDEGHVFDGRSLVPQLRGKGGGRRTMLVELPPTGEQSRREPYFAIRTQDPRLTGDTTGRKVMVYAESMDSLSLAVTDLELYDLSTDPLQVQSLHLSTEPVRQQQMQALSVRLQALQRCVGKACRTLED